MADALCLTSGVGAGRDGLQYRLSADVAGRLKVTTAIIDAVLCDVTLRLSDGSMQQFTANQETIADLKVGDRIEARKRDC